MRKTSTKFSTGHLVQVYAERKSAIQQRLEEFTSVPPSEYFYELAYCMLTPQSSAANAAKAVGMLKRHDFFHADIDPAPLLHQKDFYIRFHHTKARHLIAAKEKFAAILEQLRNGMTGSDLREWLVHNIMGLGYKEASHFLRNIGYRNLAILDRHVIKNLVRYKAIRSAPKTMTRKRYLSIEKRLQRFANRLGIPMDELDLLFWSMETGQILK